MIAAVRLLALQPRPTVNPQLPKRYVSAADATTIDLDAPAPHPALAVVIESRDRNYFGPLFDRLLLNRQRCLGGKVEADRGTGRPVIYLRNPDNIDYLGQPPPESEFGTSTSSSMQQATSRTCTFSSRWIHSTVWTTKPSARRGSGSSRRRRATVSRCRAWRRSS